MLNKPHINQHVRFAIEEIEEKENPIPNENSGVLNEAVEKHKQAFLKCAIDHNKIKDKNTIEASLKAIALQKENNEASQLASHFLEHESFEITANLLNENFFRVWTSNGNPALINFNDIDTMPNMSYLYKLILNPKVQDHIYLSQEEIGALEEALGKEENKPSIQIIHRFLLHILLMKFENWSILCASVFKKLYDSLSDAKQYPEVTPILKSNLEYLLACRDKAAPVARPQSLYFIRPDQVESFSEWALISKVFGANSLSIQEYYLADVEKLNTLFYEHFKQKITLPGIDKPKEISERISQLGALPPLAYLPLLKNIYLQSSDLYSLDNYLFVNEVVELILQDDMSSEIFFDFMSDAEISKAILVREKNIKEICIRDNIIQEEKSKMGKLISEKLLAMAPKDSPMQIKYYSLSTLYNVNRINANYIYECNLQGTNGFKKSYASALNWLKQEYQLSNYSMSYSQKFENIRLKAFAVNVAKEAYAILCEMYLKNKLQNFEDFSGLKKLIILYSQYYKDQDKSKLFVNLLRHFQVCLSNMNISLPADKLSVYRLLRDNDNLMRVIKGDEKIAKMICPSPLCIEKYVRKYSQEKADQKIFQRVISSLSVKQTIEAKILYVQYFYSSDLPNAFYVNMYKSIIFDVPEKLYPSIKKQLEEILENPLNPLILDDVQVLLELLDFIMVESAKPINFRANKEEKMSLGSISPNEEKMMMDMLAYMEPDQVKSNPVLLKKVLKCLLATNDAFSFLYGLQKRFPFMLQDIDDLGLVLSIIPLKADNINEYSGLFNNTRKYSIEDVDNLLKYVPADKKTLFLNLIRPSTNLSEYFLHHDDLVSLKLEKIEKIKPEFYAVAIKHNEKFMLGWLIYQRIVMILLLASFESRKDLDDLLLGLVSFVDTEIKLPLPNKFNSTLRALKAEKAIIPEEYHKLYDVQLQSIIANLLLDSEEHSKFYHTKKPNMFKVSEEKSHYSSQELKEPEAVESKQSSSNEKEFIEEMKKIDTLVDDCIKGLNKVRINPKKDKNGVDALILSQQLKGITKLKSVLDDEKLEPYNKIELFEKHLKEIKHANILPQKVKSDSNITFITFFRRPAPAGRVFLDKVEPVLEKIKLIMPKTSDSRQYMSPAML